MAHKCSLVRTVEQRLGAAKYALANLLPGESARRKLLEGRVRHYSRLLQRIES